MTKREFNKRVIELRKAAVAVLSAEEATPQGDAALEALEHAVRAVHPHGYRHWFWRWPDPDAVIGEQPLWYIWWYLFLINSTYLWRRACAAVGLGSRT